MLQRVKPTLRHWFPIQALASAGTFAQRSGGHFSTQYIRNNCAIAVAKAAETLRRLGSADCMRACTMSNVLGVRR